MSNGDNYIGPLWYTLKYWELLFFPRYVAVFLEMVIFTTIISQLQKYEVEFLLQQQWYDPRLRYSNQSQYEYLNAIHHHEDIWLPDTYFIMHGDFKDPLIPMHFALRIYRNGTINYLMRWVRVASGVGIWWWFSIEAFHVSWSFYGALTFWIFGPKN
jgi:hypothetical protein